MKCNSTIEEPKMDAPVISQVELPLGLLGFEQIKHYQLVTNAGEEPFQWLRVDDDASLAFVAIDPFIVLPDYQPDLPEADVAFLEMKSPGDVFLVNIVTIHSDNRATVNLKGPVVINRHTRIGKQVVITNATDYSVQHPLPVEATNS